MEEEKLTKKVADPERSLTKRERRELAKEEKRKQREKNELSGKIKKFVIIAIILLIGGWVVFSGYKYVTTSTVDSNTTSSIEVTDSDWVRGNKEAKITLVEFGDYQCPACADYEPFVEKLSQEFADDLKIVHKQYPLSTIHKNALLAAKVAEAVGKQGKYWEIHKLLYEKQDEWANDGNPRGKLVQYALDLGLDKQKLESDMDSDETRDEINKDIALGDSLRVNSTPSFFINGEKIAPRSYEEFKKIVEDYKRGYTVE